MKSFDDESDSVKGNKKSEEELQERKEIKLQNIQLSSYLSVKKFILNLKTICQRKTPKLLSQKNNSFINDLSFDYKFWKKYIKNNDKQNKKIKDAYPGKNGYFDLILKIGMRCLSKIQVFDISMIFMILWNIFSALLTLMYLFIIPLELSFSANLSQEFEAVADLKIASAFLFTLDLMLNFNTAIYIKGKLCIDRKEIIIYYLKNEFIIDLLSQVSIVVNLFKQNLDGIYDEAGWVSLFQLLFFLKLLTFFEKVRKIEQFLFLDNSTHYTLSLFKLMLRIMFITHFCACFWYLIGTIEPETSWLATNSLLSSAWHVKYLNSYNFICITMNTVGYGDLTPKNNIEKFFSIILTYFVCGLFAYNLNSIGIIFKEIAKREIEFEKHFETMNGYMKKKRIPFDLKMRVRKYLEYICKEEKIGKVEEEKIVLNKLSDTLRKELLLQGNGSVLKPLKMFSRNFTENFLRSMIPLLNEVRFTPGDIIFMKDDVENKDLYIILKGKVDIFFVSGKSQDDASVVKTLGPGETFGEISFFTDQPRRMCAKSSEFTTVYRIKRSQFMNLIKKFDYDYQKYCEIKDSINTSEDFTDLYMKCYCCDNDSHLINKCPLVNFHNSKNLILARHLYSPNQNRIKFNRKRQKSNSRKLIFFNRSKAVDYQTKILNDSETEIMSPCTVRFQQPSPAIINIKERDNSSENIIEESKESQSFKNESSSKNLDDSKKELSEDDPIKDKGVVGSNNELEIEKIIEADKTKSKEPSENKTQSKVMENKISRVTSTNSWFSQIKTISSKPFMSRSFTDLKNSEKMKNLKMHVIDIDTMKSWMFYFPENNIEHIEPFGSKFRFLKKRNESKNKNMNESVMTKLTPATVTTYAKTTIKQTMIKRNFFLNMKHSGPIKKKKQSKT